MLFSCNKDKIDYYNTIITSFNKDLLFNDYLIIVPNEGCTGCITDATDFLIKNIDHISNLAVIYTSIKDHKLFKLSLPKTFLENKNVYIDQNNLFEEERVSSIYPTILLINNKRVTETQLFDKTFFD